MLLMATTLEVLLKTGDTLTFILQHLGFLINIKKSVLEQTSTLEFFWDNGWLYGNKINPS